MAGEDAGGQGHQAVSCVELYSISDTGVLTLNKVKEKDHSFAFKNFLN
jgi:hypothetical protein